MRYPNNIGCLWAALILLLLGGTPLLVGILQVFGVLAALMLVGGFALSWWLRRQAVLRYAHSNPTHTTASSRFWSPSSSDSRRSTRPSIAAR